MNAACTIESLSKRPLAKVVARNQPGEIKSIGEALERKSPNSSRAGFPPLNNFSGRQVVLVFRQWS
jgi:hypothetical protein